ncbi:MAG: methyltransferase domain-containing protein [Gemmatimonadetes bacterium]|nr:methyltransferase domain-containing protein [Gemmatimonadota bacterium]
MPQEFVYRDKKLGDTEAITVETAPDVFQPTSTTVLLLRAARRALTPPPRSVLDVGCGSGVVAVVLARNLPAGTTVCASDLSEAAARLAGRNAARNGVTIDCRSGSLFAPWAGRQFDLIVDDVAGVSEPLARASGWYPSQVPSEAGRDGTRWILNVIDQAPDYLAPGGRLCFPVLTLSRENLVIERARARFATVTQVEEQWYPLGEDLLAQWTLVEELVADGSITIEKHGSRWCWATRVFLAERAS